jgi:hypothetical protein
MPRTFGIASRHDQEKATLPLEQFERNVDGLQNQAAVRAFPA